MKSKSFKGKERRRKNTHGNGDGLLGVILADDVAVQLTHDLLRLHIIKFYTIKSFEFRLPRAAKRPKNVNYQFARARSRRCSRVPPPNSTYPLKSQSGRLDEPTIKTNKTVEKYVFRWILEVEYS